MASKFTPIAPIFLQDTQNAINEANLRSIYTYESYGGSTVEIPDEVLVKDFRDYLNYIQYPENVKPFVKRTNSAMELQHAMTEALEFQQHGPYLPKDKVRSLRILNDFWNDTAQDMLETTLDIETFGYTNALGVEQSSVYHVAFKHNHRGQTFGKFKGGDNIQSFFIGVTDKKQIDYLNTISHIVSNDGLKNLTKDQRLTFEYLSRAGASITDVSQITDITNFAAHLTLTDRPFQEFGTLANFNKMKEALIQRGTNAMAAGKNINGHILSSDTVALIDNMAETVANSANSIVIGWNVPFDVNHLMAEVGKQPGAQEYLQERIAALTGKKGNTLPLLADFGIFRRNMIDPYRDIVRTADINYLQDLLHKIYGNSSQAVTEEPTLLGFETIAKAMGLNRKKRWTDKEKALFNTAHHDALIDTLQEDLVLGGNKSVLAQTYHSWVEDIISKYNAIESANRAPNTGAGGIHVTRNNIDFNGLILVPKTSGSMKYINDHEKSMLATVKRSNGDLITSNGMMLKTSGELVKVNQYLPGAWSAGLPYEVIGGDIIDKNSDLAKELVLLNPSLAGEDIVQFNYKLGFVGWDDELSEAALETRSVYVAESMSSRFLTNFDIVGQRDANGNVTFNNFADESIRKNFIKTGIEGKPRHLLDKPRINLNKNQQLRQQILAEGVYNNSLDREPELLRAVVRAYKGDPEDLEAILQESSVTQSPSDIVKAFLQVEDESTIEQHLAKATKNKIADRAERSFTKHSIATDRNVILMKDILHNGTFKYSSGKAELHEAIVKASQGDDTALQAILQGSSIKTSVAEIVEAFKVGEAKEFNNAWLTNVLTIAETTKKGSLYEQAVNIGLNILSEPEYQNMSGYNQGKIFGQMMNTAMNYSKMLLQKVAPHEYEQALENSIISRPVDSSRYYYLDATDFVRKYRSDRYVSKTAEGFDTYWMKIDLQNPWSVMNEVKRMTGLEGERAEDLQRLHANMIDFVDWASKNQNLSRQERRDLKMLFKGNLEASGKAIGKPSKYRRRQRTGEYEYDEYGNIHAVRERVGPLIKGRSNRHFSVGNIERKNSVEISGEVVQIFNKFASRAGAGNMPETVFSELKSPFTSVRILPGDKADYTAKELAAAMKRTAKNTSTMLGDAEYTRKELADRLKRLMLGHIDNYDKIVQDYDEPMRKMLLAIFEQHSNGAQAIAESFVNSLQGTGIHLSIGDRSVALKFGNRPEFDITDLIPKLRTNTTGTLSWIFNPRETKYIAASMLELNDNMGLHLGSMMEYSYRNWFRSMNSKIKANIGMGEDPLTLIEWFWKKPAENMRKIPRTEGMPAGDMRNLLYAYVQPILENKNMLQRVVDYGRSLPLNESQDYSISILEKYISNFNNISSPIMGEAEGEALTNLLFGQNAILSNKIANVDDAFVLPGAKQTGAEGIRYSLATMPGVFELQNDPNKMIQHQLDNSIYFDIDMPDWRKQILKDGNVDLRFGPMIATPGEEKLSVIKSGSKTLSNRLQLGIVEANDQVKTQIYNMLVQKNHDDTLIAEIFGSQFMPYEGGGWINSRVWDVLYNPVAGQAKLVGNEFAYVPRMNKEGYLYSGRGVREGQVNFTEGDWIDNFLKKADLQFDDLGYDEVDFKGYGKGMFVAADDPIWGTFSKFKNNVESTFAERDSIVSLVYRTKDGKQIVDANTLKTDVEAELERRGIKKITRAEWEDAANALYDRTLIAKRVFDEGFLKLGFATDKHISQSGLRPIATYVMNDDESLLYDIFTGDAFEDVKKRLGTDFTQGKTLTADIYYDAARMEFKSPIWGGRKQASKIKQAVEEQVYEYLYGASATPLADLRSNDITAYRKAQGDIANWFYNAMDKARHLVSDQVYEITHGGTVLGANMELVGKHGNIDQSFYATLHWLEKQIAEHAQTTQKANTLSTECIYEATRILLENKVLVDRSWKALDYSIDPQTGKAIINAKSEDVYIDSEALRKVYGFDGVKIDTTVSDAELGKRMGIALSPFSDVRNDNIFASMSDVFVLKDTEGSNKLYKMTDRELNTYQNVLWEDKMIQRIHDAMKADHQEDLFNDIYGQYLENGQLKKELIGRSMYERDIDRFFKYDAFTRYEQKSLSLSGDNVLFKPRIDGSYRDKKTAELVNNLGEGVNVSNSYAEDLYEVSSLQKARSFNAAGKNKISASDLLTDNGKADLSKGEFFFKEADLLKVNTYMDASKEANKSSYNLHKHNLLVNLVDEEAGLNTLTLRGRDKLAIAGVSLSRGENAMPTEFQKEFVQLQNLQKQLRYIKETGDGNYEKTLIEFNNTLDKVIAMQDEYASGKIKTSKTARLQETRMAASATNKVQVLNTRSVTNQAVVGADTKLADNFVGKTFNGRNLADYYKEGSNVRPNFAIVGIGDLEKMGFTEEYAKKNGYKSYDEFLDIVRTKGIAGAVHRHPSDYLGSTMQVQIYLDDKIASPDKIVYDDITAAFLKADADGDYATVMAHTVVTKNGNRVDLATALAHSDIYGFTDQQLQEFTKNVNELSKLHSMHMNTQIYDLNRMVKAASEYQEVINQTVNDYIDTITKSGKEIYDPMKNILSKNKRMDLRGLIRTVHTVEPTLEAATQYFDTFGKYRKDINNVISSIQDIDKGWAAKFMSEDTGHATAVAMLQEKISEDRTFRQQLEKGLGKNLNAVNEAFLDATMVNEAKQVALQRMARKGVGLADTPYTAIDFLRMSAIGSGRNVLTNEENAAMYIVKEMSKEQLLTAKKGDEAVMGRVSQSLEELSTLMDDILQRGKNNKELEEQFVNFMSKTARDANSRYAAEAFLAEFADTKAKNIGEISNEKVYRYAYQGIVKAAEDMRQNTSINPKSYMELSRYFKGRVWDTYQPRYTQSYAARLNRAVKLSNGDFEMPTRFKPNFGNFEQQAMQRQAQIHGKDIIEKTVRNYRPGKGLAVAALGLAGAAVFGGYAGGNPARPAQQQAQEIYEQNPPPRNINMADPSLTASGRKQPGYVININAQTQRDKEYASRLITQAVTQNFQDTNVNVSMNVNQQPGNISGKDLMDYLEQVL